MICFDDDEGLDLGLPREDARGRPEAADGALGEAPEGAPEQGDAAWSSRPWRAWMRFLQERTRRAS